MPFNVIPSEVEMQGTIRTFEPKVREQVLDRFQEVVVGAAETFGCQAEVEVASLTPAVINDAAITERVQRLAERVLPDSQVGVSDRTMGSEDMAFMMQEVPGCFIFIGSANEEEGLSAPHHHPRFDFDEQALPQGAALLAAAAMEFLRDE
jgi:amidohydrolase